MDTSKEYIKMCQKATEIQELCPFKEGDFIFNLLANRGCGHLFVNHQHQPKEDDAKWELIYLKKDNRKFNIWLPRQDQLQEMLDKKRPVNEVNYFVYNTTLFRSKHPFEFAMCESLDQVWLSIVMWVNYSKIYNYFKQQWQQ